MRISDWSSDVCSSDLKCLAELIEPGLGALSGGLERIIAKRVHNIVIERINHHPATGAHCRVIARPKSANELAQFLSLGHGCNSVIAQKPTLEIGRASCRERVCKSV